MRKLLGDAVELHIEEHVSTVHLPSGEACWQLFSSSYGPTKTAAEALDKNQSEQFHQTWVEFFDSHYRSGNGNSHTREYLLVLGTRR